MLKKIEETAGLAGDGSKPQCYVLFILSHGDVRDETGEEYVQGTDEQPVTKKKIRDTLMDKNCPNLIGVPRVLFFCCCRGGT